ncbi:porin [Sutterella wadsworthensis]|uniref:porin n=1 Tax=Sutterella wadsworthensis TaxID=40545 RepID=UPI002665C69E|nr:porin [Sutterella wadsworthensis]
MKKTLAALAVLGAFAGSAMAADVTLYGALDTGFEYKHAKSTGEKAVDTFDMQTGWDTGNRWGLKGSEDLGNGYKVSFKLESGFNGDDGTMGQGSRLFGREAGLTLSGPFGSVAFGRFGGIASSAGTYDMLGYVESFDGGDGDVWGFASSDRYDNMVVYQTPRFAGLQLTAQYSFKTDSKDDAKYTKNADGTFGQHYSGDEGTSHAQRYASVGLSGEYGPASFAVGYELTKYGANDNGERALDKDGQLVFLGGNYDFEVVQLFAEAQYFKHQTALNTNEWGEATAFGKDALGLKGYGLHLGAAAPLVGGTLTAGLYYVDYSEEFDAKADQDYKFYGVSARYNYPLSERTGVYAGAGYGQTKADDSGDKAQITQVYCGLVHTF